MATTIYCTTWYYHDTNGLKQGPILTAQLQALITNRTITPETRVVTGGGKEIAARKIKGITFPPTTNISVKIIPGNNFCTHCGNSIVRGATACRSCGMDMYQDKSFCRHCGTAVSDRQQITCEQCGNFLSRLITPSSELYDITVTTGPPQQFQYQADEASQPEGKPAEPKLKLTNIFLGLTIAGILFAALCLFLLVGGQILGQSLHSAVLSGEVQTVLKHIEWGADVNHQNKDGDTPLHLAVSRGHVEIVQTLLVTGADVNVKNRKGKTPLDVLEWTTHSHKRAIRQLLVPQVPSMEENNRRTRRGSGR